VSKPVVDWSVFKRWELPMLTCRCGSMYRSACKHTWQEGEFVSVSEHPCPSCGEDVGNVVRAEHPSETWTIGGA
jgi:ribosomal protein L37AE/L43A